MQHQGWAMRQTTAGEVHAGTSPDEMEDMFVLLPDRASLVEVWDIGIELQGGQVVLFGNFPDTPVSSEHPIYYSPPERWA